MTPATPRLLRVFRPNEEPAKGFRRILERMAAQAKLAERLSSDASSDSVHKTRVLIKHLRALLWFAGAAIRSPEKDRIQAQLWEASHLLASQRDLEVTQALLKKLSRKWTQPLEPIAEKLTQATGHEADAVQQASSLLLKALEEFVIQVNNVTRWPSLPVRLTKACRATKKAGKKALKSEAPAQFHRWRKKAKRLLYLLQWNLGQGKRIPLLIKGVDKLQRKLGQYHDCVIAEEQVEKNSLPTEKIPQSIGQLQKRQSRLKKSVRKLFRRLRPIRL